MNNSKKPLALTDKLYQELKGCANRIMANQNANLTLQTTEVVHEACIRLIESSATYNDKAHIYRCAAKAMRHLLIDHARGKSAIKRGGAIVKTQWLDDLLSVGDENIGLLVIDETINELAAVSERLETIAELYYFAGFSQAQIAELLSLGLTTVEGELRFARAFLIDKLQHSE
ncbi:MAG: ECF-type sigma factor [Psychrosphaera sp.]|nr:ECF-type sigma factor [Psychrosphaera sp.]